MGAHVGEEGGGREGGRRASTIDSGGVPSGTACSQRALKVLKCLMRCDLSGQAGAARLALCTSLAAAALVVDAAVAVAVDAASAATVLACAEDTASFAFTNTCAHMAPSPSLLACAEQTRAFRQVRVCAQGVLGRKARVSPRDAPAGPPYAAHLWLEVHGTCKPGIDRFAAAPSNGDNGEEGASRHQGGGVARSRRRGRAVAGGGRARGVCVGGRGEGKGGGLRRTPGPRAPATTRSATRPPARSSSLVDWAESGCEC